MIYNVSVLTESDDPQRPQLTGVQIIADGGGASVVGVLRSLADELEGLTFMLGALRSVTIVPFHPDEAKPTEDLNAKFPPPNGGVLLAVKPRSEHEGDKHLATVLCYLPHNVSTPYVVWTRNSADGGYHGGRYCRDFSQAAGVFDETGVLGSGLAGTFELSAYATAALKEHLASGRAILGYIYGRKEDQL